MKSINIFKNKFATTTTIVLNYVFKIKDEDCAAVQFLPMILEQKGSFYNNSSEMLRSFARLYGTIVSAGVQAFGQCAIVTFHLIVPHEKYVGEDVLNDAVRMLKESLLDTSDARYDDSMLGANRQEVIKYARELENRVCEMGRYRILSQIQPKARISSPFYRRLKDIEKVDITAIKRLHKSMLSGSIYVFAETPTKENNLKKILKSNFNFRIKKSTNKFHAFNSQYVKKSEKVQFNIPQSAVYMLYKYEVKDNLNPVSVMNMALQNELFNVIREEHGLCYHIEARTYTSYDVLLIRTNTDMENIEEVIFSITELMKEYALDEESLNSAKLMQQNSIEGVKDDFLSRSRYMLSRHLRGLSSEYLDEIKEIKDFTLDEVNMIVKSLRLIAIHVAKGVDKHENQA